MPIYVFRFPLKNVLSCGRKAQPWLFSKIVNNPINCLLDFLFRKFIVLGINATRIMFHPNWFSSCLKLRIGFLHYLQALLFCLYDRIVLSLSGCIAHRRRDVDSWVHGTDNLTVRHDKTHKFRSAPVLQTILMWWNGRAIHVIALRAWRVLFCLLDDMVGEVLLW